MVRKSASIKGLNTRAREVAAMTNFKACSIKGCDRNADRSEQGRNGYCCAHYARAYRYGDPNHGGALEKKKPKPGEIEKFVAFITSYTGGECIAWPFSRPQGRGRVTLPDGSQQTASRYICRLVRGDPPDESMDCAHECGKGDDGCVTPNHLRWDTRSGNHADKAKHGTDTRGEKSWNAKLTRTDVIRIREMGNTMKQTEIAAKFGVRQGAISLILSGKNWGWLSQPVTSKASQPDEG